MVEGGSARRPCVIAIGDGREDLVTQTVQLASEYDVAVVRCDDVYSAVAELAAPGDVRVLVVGRFGEMAREHARLFALAMRHGATCCCLVDRDRPVEHGDVLAAARAGATLVGQAGEVAAILQNWLSRQGCHVRAAGRDLADEECRATEAELNALLGREVDG